MNTDAQTEQSEAEVAIRFVSVSKSFGRGARRNQVLQSASFSVPTGKTTVIAGGSGQGKSVTLKLILGLLKPQFYSIYDKSIEDFGLLSIDHYLQ